MSISKIFIPNFVCVLTNERYKAYQKGFSFCDTGHAPGWEFGALGVPREVGGGGLGGVRGQKLFFSNMVMWHIKSTRMTSRTKCK